MVQKRNIVISASYIKNYLYTRRLSTAVIVCAALAAWVVYFPLTNTDIWWHLAAGREMVRRKAFLYTDTFAYSSSETGWIDVHWFFQLVVYFLHSVGGVALLVWTKILAVFVAVIVISYAQKDKWCRFFTASLMVVLLYHARYLVLMRPILITIMAMVLYITVLERYSTARNRRVLLWLIPVQLVWTNSQGLFILGPVILGCYWLGELIKTLLGRSDGLQNRGTFGSHVNLTVALLVIVLSTLVNPYGIQGALFPFKLFERIDPSYANIYSRNISENIPLMSLEGLDRRYMYVVFAVTAIALIGFVLNRKKVRWSHVLLTLAFFSLAYMAKRNILLYFVVVAPVLAANLADIRIAVSRRNLRKGRVLHLTVSGILMALIAHSAYSHARVVGHYPSRTMVSPFRVPRKAVEFLQKNPAPGALFNTVRYGGYLIWKLYPSREVFIDGRLIIRSAEFFAGYLAVCSNPEENFPALARRFAITHVLLPTAVYQQCMPLVKFLYEHEQWKVVYADGSSILFRDNGLTDENQVVDLASDEQVSKILATIDRQWSGDDLIKKQHVVYLQRLLSYLGLEQQAEKCKKFSR